MRPIDGPTWCSTSGTGRTAGYRHASNGQSYLSYSGTGRTAGYRHASNGQSYHSGTGWTVDLNMVHACIQWTVLPVLHGTVGHPVLNCGS